MTMTRAGKIKQPLALLIALASLTLMTGCSSDTKDTNSNTATSSHSEEKFVAEYPLTIRVGYSTGADDPRGIALDTFCETVTENTNGDILFEIHPSGELGSDSELIAGMIEKKVDMTVSSAGNYALYATKIGVSALPFLFDGFESAWAFIDSEEMQALNPELEDYNMHVLAYFDNGFRCVTTSENKGPVDNAAKMEGLNIRTPANQIVMETMSELGANPRSYPFAELKQALKDGVFDAQENPIPVIYNNKLYEVQKYLSVTNHSYDAMPLTIRMDIWEQLTPEYQDIINTAAKEAESMNRSLVKQQTEECVKNLEAEGMIVVYPDLGPFRRDTKGVMDMFNAVYGEELIRYVTKSK